MSLLVFLGARISSCEQENYSTQTKNRETENMAKIITAVAFSAFVLAGCDTPGKTVGLGAAAGAGGAALLGADPLTGAIIGAGAGAICEAAEGCN